MAEAALPRDQLDWVLKLARRTLRYWWVAGLMFVVGLAATVYIARHRQPKWSSQAVVYYQEGVSLNLAGAEGGPSAHKMGQRLKETVLARSSIAKLIQDLDLYPDLRRAGRLNLAVDRMRAAISFKISPGDTYTISYTGPTPRLAQKVTARITDKLIEENARMRGEQAEVVRAFLDEEKQRNEESLRAKESELVKFLAHHPEFASELPGAQVAPGAAVRASAKRGAVDPEALDDSVLQALRREEARLKRQIAHPAAPPTPPADPALVAARNEAEARLNAARRDLADKRARFTEQHPDVRAAAAQVRQAEGALKHAAEALKTAAPADEDVVEIEPRAALVGRLSQVQQQIRDHLAKRDRAPAGSANAASTTSDAALRIVAVETEWARLNRELSEARERYEQLDTRQFAATMTASSLASGRAAQIVVIDPAYLPAKPLGSSPRRVMAMGGAAALLLGLALAVACALVDDRLFDRLDVERLGLAPVLTEVPAVKRARSRRG